jgi:hypothetical protein
MDELKDRMFAALLDFDRVSIKSMTREDAAIICASLAKTYAQEKVKEQRLLMSTHLNMRNVPTPKF